MPTPATACIASRPTAHGAQSKTAHLVINQVTAKPAGIRWPP